MDLKVYTSVPHGYQVEIETVDPGWEEAERSLIELEYGITHEAGLAPDPMDSLDLDSGGLPPWNEQFEEEDWFYRYGAIPAPDGIADTPPGQALMGLLQQVDVRFVGNGAVTDTLAGWERLAAYAQSQRARAITEMYERASNLWGATNAMESATLDVSAELHLSRSAAETEVETAIVTCNRLPQVLELWEQGLIDIRRVRVFALETGDVPDDLAREMVAKVADQVPEWTAGQLRARLRKLCIELDPEGETERLDQAVGQRTVEVWPGAGGSANLWLSGLSPDDATAIMERLDALARSLPADGRSMDQRRVDVAVDLLMGRPDLPPISGRGVVDLTIDLRTLMRMAENPGELGGWGPVVAEIARNVAGAQVDGKWQATVTDDNGDPYAVAVRRRPSASQARQVRARAPRCIFPGCRRPARRCDLDHRDRWANGGPTLECNLDPICRFHHRAKEELGWTYQPLGYGDYRWTSPTGHTYTTSGRDP